MPKVKDFKPKCLWCGNRYARVLFPGLDGAAGERTFCSLNCAALLACRRVTEGRLAWCDLCRTWGSDEHARHCSRAWMR